ncbi:hypothetical protein NPIL_308221 [Nephila pilipes]|uniref:Uncharacterized protein n=1 Tax=Nephila pilipes TaxID=299642 RepID=A0A8X6MZ05_NEPPI|nr:hypothetical protein NPIL_308221 [Nephila pilipes]
MPVDRQAKFQQAVLPPYGDNGLAAAAPVRSARRMNINIPELRVRADGTSPTILPLSHDKIQKHFSNHVQDDDIVGAKCG